MRIATPMVVPDSQEAMVRRTDGHRSRYLQGCDADRDALESRLAVLRRPGILQVDHA